MNNTTIKHITMNSEPNTYDFSYLKKWDKKRLRDRLGVILPTINFLLAMHNAKDKVVKIDLSCMDANINVVKDYTIHLSTFSTAENQFPREFDEFIHNYCTFLCAEKMHIELLLSV